MQFVDRQEEAERLTSALSTPGGALVVLYGRRRLGKSTLPRQHDIIRMTV